MNKILILMMMGVLPLAGTRAQETLAMFYNVENLFDTQDDSVVRDEEYLPQAQKGWTYERMYRKVVRVYQVLVASGEGELPAIVGLCEVENRFVLERLVYDTPLSRAGYRVIHRDSPDARGIDVALIYRPELFEPDSSEWLHVDLPGGGQTREILHVRGRLLGVDSVHVYVNHWPSRYGGAAGSEPRRFAAAAALASSVRKVMQAQVQPNVIVMGDFNDEPQQESMLMINRILAFGDSAAERRLVNLAGPGGAARSGTIKHSGRWAVFDQVLVSHTLAEGMNRLAVRDKEMSIFGFGFLLEPDERYSGGRPYRTYLGPQYHGGFSDHLPVGVRIMAVSPEARGMYPE